MNLLYIEDNLLDAELVKGELSRSAPHIKVGVAVTYAEAVAKLAACTPKQPVYDLVLTDIDLPDGSGLSLLPLIQERDLNLAVVVLAEAGNEASVAAALKAGASDFVIKRVDYAASLAPALEAALQRYRAEIVRKASPLRVLYAEHYASEGDLTRRHFAQFAPYIQLQTVNVLDETFRNVAARGDGDVLLLNYHRPGLNGVEPLKNLLRTWKDDLPVVLVVEAGDEGVALQALQWGAADYVVKTSGYLHKLPTVLENAFLRVRLTREQAAAKANETYFRSLVESISSVMVVLRADCMVQYASPSVEQVLGYKPEALVGGDGFAHFHPEDAPRVREACTRALLNPGVASPLGEVRLRRQDGAWRCLEAVGQGLEAEAAGMKCVVIHGHDITERKQAETALADNEKRFRALIEHSGEAVVFVSPEGNIFYQSPAAGRMLGLPTEGYEGHKIEDLIHADDLPAYQTLWSQLTQTPGAGGRGQYRFQHQEGGWRWIELTATDWLADAKVEVVVVNYRDITEEVERERELATLVSVSRALRTAQTRSEMVAVILDQVLALLKAEAAAMLRRDPVTGQWKVELGQGRAAPLTGQILPAGDWLVDAVSAADQPYVTNNAQAELRQTHGEMLTGVNALVGIPLVAQDQPMGALWLSRQSPVSEAEVALFTAIGNTAANALRRATLHEQTAQYARQMATASKVGRVLAETFEVSKIYACLGQAVHELLPDICGVFISLFDMPHNRLVCVYAFSDGEFIEPADLPRIPLGVSGRGPQSEAFHARRPVIINNLRERRGPAAGKTGAAPEPEGLPQASLYVPMLVQGRVVGVVQVQSDLPNRFSQSDAEVLMLIGNTAAAAIDNAHLFQTTRRQLDELSLVSRVALATASREPFDQAVAQATEALKQLWPHTSALGFLFMDPAAAELRLHPSYQGIAVETALPIPLDQGLVGWVARQQQPVRVGKVLADPRYVPMTIETRSQMAAPLVVGDETLGVINVESAKLEAFSAEDLRLLTKLAQQLSLFFEKVHLDGKLAAHAAKLEQQVKERTAQLETANAKLQLANEAKSEFLSRMSFAFRPPLNALLGFARLLEIDSWRQETRDNVRQIFWLGQHLLVLIDEVRDIAQIESGQMPLALELIPLEVFVQAVLDLVKPLAAKSQIMLQVDIPGKWLVQADLQRLKLVLLNLLSSVIQHNVGDSWVVMEIKCVQCRTPAGEDEGDEDTQPLEPLLPWLRFNVRSTGMMSEMFTPLAAPTTFEQMDLAQTDRQTAGLELALFKYLIEAMHGVVGIKGSAGQDVICWIELPLVKVPEKPEVNTDLARQPLTVESL